MIKFGSPFQNGMVLQRQKPICIFGYCSEESDFEVKLNKQFLTSIHLNKGKFKVYLPPQEAVEGATLEIGKYIFQDVDIGEVWLAGGQSNIEFLIKWDADRETIYKLPPDPHFRYFEVGKYTFEGEKEEGIADNFHWDEWHYFNSDNSPYFSSASTYFALEMRKKLRIPIGIVSCCRGGTSASAWVPQKDLTGDLKVYLDEYENEIKDLDMNRYLKLNRLIRETYNPDAKDFVMRNTITKEEREKIQTMGRTKEQIDLLNKLHSEYSNLEISKRGPHTANRPCALYNLMLKKISGFSVRGILWYQGCEDAKSGKSHLYENLLKKLIFRWRKKFGNVYFIVVQLAPFGSWMNSNGIEYPTVRNAQEKVCDTTEKCVLVSLSDSGNEFDIHPKHKSEVGHRMCLQALNKIYGFSVVSDAPRFLSAERKNHSVLLVFKNAKKLNVDGNKINSLFLFVDDISVDYIFFVNDNVVVLSSDKIDENKKIEIKFAWSGFYKVNLVNEGGLPAFPFKITI